MEDLVNWLIGIEDSAAQAYFNASKLFPEDPEFSAFLRSLSKDEIGHYNAMCVAKAHLKDIEDYPAAVVLDPETKWDIEAPFHELSTKLYDGKITKQELMHYIVVIEYCELNQLFLFVLGALKERTDGLVNLSIDVGEHKDRIEDYVSAHPEFAQYLEMVRGLPVEAGSSKRMLIVDDNESIRSMLKAIFESQFATDTAANGAEAFEKFSSGNYTAVITDVDMPLMDGIEFYSKAREIIPEMGGRFIFYTGSLSKERISFFNENRVQYLVKPAAINRLRSMVSNIVR